MKSSLNFMLFNLENFFLPPYYINRSYPDPPSKNIFKIIKIKEIILEHSPDFIMLTEVGGEDSLNNFNKNYLNDLYYISLIEGNSDRGIELAYLIKKELPFSYEHLTHRNRIIDFNYQDELHKKDRPKYNLSRDIAELRIFKNGQKDQDTIPSMILLLVHLKSKLDSENRDKEGIKRREAEFNLVIKTYLHLNKRYQGKVPILIAGDFNGNAAKNNTDKEFQDLYQTTDLEDFMELITTPAEERFTYIHFPEHYKGLRQQLDYIFLSKKFSSNIIAKSSGVYRFHDNENIVLPIPTNRSLSYTLPSDHYPLFLELKNII